MLQGKMKGSKTTTKQQAKNFFTRLFDMRQYLQTLVKNMEKDCSLKIVAVWIDFRPVNFYLTPSCTPSYNYLDEARECEGVSREGRARRVSRVGFGVDIRGRRLRGNSTTAIQAKMRLISSLNRSLFLFISAVNSYSPILFFFKFSLQPVSQNQS